MDVDDPDLLQYVEDWESTGELNRQIPSDRFTRLIELTEAASEPSEFEFRFFEDVRWPDYIVAQRG